MAEFLDRDDSGRIVKFYDADEDGVLADLFESDPWEWREEVLRRIDELDRASSFRPATREEIKRKKESLLGQEVNIVCGSKCVSGEVLSIDVFANRRAIYKIMKGDQTDPIMSIADVAVEGFFEIDQEPN